MKERSGSGKIVITILLSIIICYASYTATAVFGLLTFPSGKIDNDITKNYDASDIFVLVGLAALIAKTITIYPILLFCAKIAIQDIFVVAFGYDYSTSLNCLRHFLIVMTWFFSSLIFAIFTPNIGIVIDMLGSLATLFIFIFPGICLIFAILYKDPNIYLHKDRIHIFIASLYIVLGTFIFGLSVTQAIRKNFFDNFTNNDQVKLCI